MACVCRLAMRSVSAALDRWRTRLLSALRRQLARLGDDDFAALAGAGLLRRARKDLASLSPTLAATDEAVTVNLGSHQVVLDARGPAHARCSCPARTQHILAACLFAVREARGAAPSAEEAAGSAICEGCPGPGHRCDGGGVRARPIAALRHSCSGSRSLRWPTSPSGGRPTAALNSTAASSSPSLTQRSSDQRHEW